MNRHLILIPAFCLLFCGSAAITTSHAATVFGGSRIVAIDKDQRTITFKTKEGQTWTLPVTDPKLLNGTKDDQVTIEIDLNDRITNVVKASDAPAAPRTENEDR